MDKVVLKTIQKLKSNSFWFGSAKRANAAKAFIGTYHPEAVEPLIEALQDTNEGVKNNAYQALCSLNGKARDHICALWAKGRDNTLEDVILKSRYLASDPPELRILTLFVNEMEIDTPVSKEAFEICLKDDDKRISQGMINHTIKNKDEDRYMALWAFAKEHPDSHVAEALHEKKWRPEEPSERALFYYLSNDLTAYHDIDFDQRHLRVWYETGGKEIRDAIASRIRKSGDVRLLSLFKTERGSRKGKLAHDEVHLQMEIHQKKKDYMELFSLLKNASFEQGKGVISSIRDARWVNPDGRWRELQDRLEALFSKETDEKGQSSYADAFYHDFRPMLVGNEDPPGDEAGLLAWAGDKGNFRHRSAAVTILAERKHTRLSDIANSSAGDAYWQVRMAAAVAELLRPGTLSPANKALLGEDHVYYVQAILKMPSASRSLSAMTTKEIEALHENIAVSDPKQRPQDADNFMELIKGFVQTAEREYLKILSEFFSTEIVASEEASYEAGETDVEIEVADNNAPQAPQKKQGKHKKN